LQPLTYTYRGVQETPGERSALLDYFGDNLAQVILRKESTWNIYGKLSYYELSHIVSPTDPEKRVINLPKDLLELSLRNTMVNEEPFRSKLKENTGLRPVRLLAMSLPGARAWQSVQDIVGKGTEELYRPPVLVRAYPNKAGLVICRRNMLGEDQFKYHVIKNFDQKESGEISGQLSDDASDDPLNYLGKVGDDEFLATFRTDREWLKFSHEHEMPIAIFSLVRVLTLSPRLENNIQHIASIPDFILVANRGFNFNSSYTTESDHGAFSKEESQVVFYVSDIKSSDKGTPQKFETPILTRDIAPTVMEYLGFDVHALSQGQSMKSTVERINP
ncbi:MAG: hypothetical protein WCG27_11575, partial [Pseudomonadota bacterium]